MANTSFRTIYAFAAAIAACMATMSVAVSAADNEVAPTRLPNVDVIGTTPLPGVGLPLEQIPAPVQSATSTDIDRSNALELTDFMNRRLGSVYINEVQNNPFQPDVNYRGFTASPLLGTPQGLSIYMDGVRLNQPFGDVVSWDLIPKSAIASIDLMPGSNPLFGLNTLGGALSIQTKDGRNYPGSVVQAMVGSYGRNATELTHGGFNDDKGIDWFFTGNLFRDNGWRTDSPSNVGQFFSKLGWHDARSSLKLTYAYANTSLYGNGLQEQRFLDRDYASVFTKPDITDNQSIFVNLAGMRSIGDSVTLSGNAYYRKINTNTYNGDLNDDSLNQAVYLTVPSADRTALVNAGYTGLPTASENKNNTAFPFWRCIASTLLATGEPHEKCDGVINRTQTAQINYGLSGQFTKFGSLWGQANQFTGGGGYDLSTVTFRQSAQFGYLNPDRSVTGINAFADGSKFDDDGSPIDSRVALDGHIHTWSVYATDTLSIRDVWHLTLSARYNQTMIRNADLINPGGGASSLDGNYTYNRLNPAIGLSVTPTRALNGYIGYNEGSRAPTSIELGCANPANPCRLPNSMAGDPPLNQVVTKTWEAGLRGMYAGGTRWNAGVFRANNDDDILFVAAPNQPQSGFFKNFGKTRRQGVELGLNSNVGKLTFGANYTYLDATFQSPEIVPGGNNSSNSLATGAVKGLEGGTIQIVPGNRIPLVPQHIFKLFADYQYTPSLLVNMNVIAIGNSYARGNENNAQQPDGTFYQGPGKSGGYAVLNMGSQYRFEPRLTLLTQVNNVLNREYSTASLLGPTGFTNNGNFVARPFANPDAFQHATFYAPGAPRTFWVGLRYTLDAPKGKL